MEKAPLLICCLAFVAVVAPNPAAGQAPAEDVERIRRMSGCFQVTYRFAEDGEHDLFSPEYGLEEPITEWIGFERRDDGRLVLVHVGLRQGRPVPHFHEVWKLAEGGEGWRHEVWDRTPDDSDRELRYACEGEWEMNRWRCAAGRAGKPFRDSGAPFGFDRNDYDWLDRTNTLLVTPGGWVHQEQNRKMTEDGGLVAYELGWITYERIDSEACGAAPRRF